MNLDLATPALLFPAIAILMLGFVNRYVAAAAVIRNFRKDYDEGYKHVKLVDQLYILKERIALLRISLFLSGVALVMACLSMLFVYTERQGPAKIIFGLSLAFMILALITALLETKLSNTSLNIEIDDVLHREEKRKQKD